jgi:signal transduction histidine kinase
VDPSGSKGSTLSVNESAQLADLCQQMEKFTSTLAHDLRGSLHLLTVYVELLAEETNGSLAADQLKYLNVIKSGIEGIRVTVERGQARLHELIGEKS